MKSFELMDLLTRSQVSRLYFENHFSPFQKPESQIIRSSESPTLPRTWEQELLSALPSQDLALAPKALGLHSKHAVMLWREVALCSPASQACGTAPRILFRATSRGNCPITVLQTMSSLLRSYEDYIRYQIRQYFAEYTTNHKRNFPLMK